jgi:hypothetical protein
MQTAYSGSNRSKNTKVFPRHNNHHSPCRVRFGRGTYESTLGLDLTGFQTLRRGLSVQQIRGSQGIIRRLFRRYFLTPHVPRITPATTVRIGLTSFDAL